MKKMCRCFKEGDHGFRLQYMYPFEELKGGKVEVDDPPIFTWRFENREEFDKYFIEIDDKGRAVYGDRLVWTTEGGREIPVANMTADYIINCIIWLGNSPLTFIKDCVEIHEWMRAFGSELEKRKGGDK